MQKVVVTMLKSRTTDKGTVLYEIADRGSAPVSNVYVRKSAFEGQPAPDKVTVTVESAE